MYNLRNKTIVVVGAQKSGLAVCKLGIQCGAKVKLTDMGLAEKLSTDVQDFIKHSSVICELGKHTEEFISNCDLMVLSPGVRFDAKPVQWAKDKNIPVLGEIEFAFQFCDKPVIAVTGSNGKTTTVNLIHLILQASGYKSCLCGNVGDPFSHYALDINKNDFVVLEVSSFQMESLLNPLSSLRRENGGSFKGFKPYVAAVLNFNPNHLDRHKDIEEYFEAKTRVFLNQTTDDFSVLNHDNEALKKLAKQLKSKVILFSESEYKNLDLNPNQSAILKIAEALNLKADVCFEIFKSFKGIEHRLEMVATIDGIDFINDSKSTTLESGKWALSNVKKPAILICGGSDKNLDYHPLKNLVKSKVKHMLVIGEIREKLKQTFSDVVSVKDCGSDFLKTIETAKSLAEPGDCILLSPMTASFDMFKNFEHRGQVFKEIVKTLKDNGRTF